MPIPSVEKVETFDENLDSAEDFVNSSAETFTTHTGLTRQTITGVINSAVQRPIVPFDSGDAYPDDSVWVEQPPSGGAIYRPKPSALPIAAGPFDPADWALSYEKISTDPSVYDVIIAYGQSNTVGFAGQPGVPAVDDYATPTPNEFALAYDIATDSIITVSNTMNHLNYIDEGGPSRGNAWTAFANKWIEETGRGCVIVNAGRGGRAINVLGQGSGWYTNMINGYAATKAAMTAQGIPLGKTYMVFHQGESDQSSGTSFETYKNLLKALCVDVKTDIPELSKIGIYIVGCPDSRNQWDWHRIQAAQYAACEENENVSVIYDGCVSFDALSGQYNAADGTHYSQRGYNQMGEGGARGLAQWVKNGTNLISSEEQKESKMRIKGPGYAMAQYVAGRAKHSGGDWSLLRRNNTTNTNAYYPCYVQSVFGEVSDGIADNEIRFKFSGLAPVFYDYSVTLSKTLIEQGVKACAEKYRDGEEYGISVKFFADITFLANVNTGAVLGANPPAANAFLASIVSGVSTVTDVATLTHPSIKQVPTVSYYSGGTMTVGSVGVRSDSSTQTRVTTDGVNNQVIVSMRDVPLTRAMLENIGDFEVGISAMISIYHSEQAGSSL